MKHQENKCVLDVLPFFKIPGDRMHQDRLESSHLPVDPWSRLVVSHLVSVSVMSFYLNYGTICRLTSGKTGSE